MRINARLDPDHSRKLEFLRQRTRVGITEILRRGIDAYYREIKQDGQTPGAILGASGFIGCAEGPGDLSGRYKELLTTGLAAKHGHR